MSRTDLTGRQARGRTARRLGRRGTAIALTLPMVATITLAGTAEASAASHHPARRGVAGAHPAWAKPSADRGTARSADQVNLTVSLAGRNPAGLAAYAQAVSSPGNASYQHYLTPAQVRARYGATAAQRTAVTNWLRAAGLKVTGSSEHAITASGSVSAAQKAFGVSLHDYSVHVQVPTWKTGADGVRKSVRTTVTRVERAPSATPTVPAEVAAAISGVTGLSTAPQQASPTYQSIGQTAKPSMVTPSSTTKLPPPQAFVPHPHLCSTYYGQNKAKNLPAAYGKTAPWRLCGYNSSQMRAAYGAKNSHLTGKGVTVAILDAYASPTIAKDVDTYSKRNGVHPMRKGQLSQVLPTSWKHTGTGTNGCGAAGWYGEETLDVEAVHNMAPDAKIEYYGAKSCYDADLLAAFNKIVDNRAADMISDSWSGSESADSIKTWEGAFQRAAVEGIGVYFSSGDDGGTVPAGYPSTDPWITSVGGTSLAVGKHHNYEWETGWGDDYTTAKSDLSGWNSLPGAYDGGAGGGISALLAQPFYQKGVVPAKLSKAGGAKTPMRVYPDVSAVADVYTGMLLGETLTLPSGKLGYTEQIMGGTSLACPTFVGEQALAQQAQHGVPIGFANPRIYSKAGTSAFHDVTDHPLGRGQSIALAHASYVNHLNGKDGDTFYLFTLGHNAGANADNMAATPGYDATTGVGTPTARYLKDFKRGQW